MPLSSESNPPHTMEDWFVYKFLNVNFSWKRNVRYQNNNNKNLQLWTPNNMVLFLFLDQADNQDLILNSWAWEIPEKLRNEMRHGFWTRLLLRLINVSLFCLSVRLSVLLIRTDCRISLILNRGGGVTNMIERIEKCGGKKKECTSDKFKLRWSSHFGLKFAQFEGLKFGKSRNQLSDWWLE